MATNGEETTPEPPPEVWPSPGVPTQPIYIVPPVIWPSPGVPTHPIYYPPTIWPDPGVPTHPIAPGGPPPVIWPGPGYPAHPIAPGGPPPSVWPDPGHPAHPIAPGGPPPVIWPGPGYPAHPIAPGGPPPGIWPSPGHPEHPIVLPPEPGVPPDEVVVEGGFFVFTPNATTPVAYVKADDTASAANVYADTFNLSFGTKVQVVTESEAFTVTTDEAEVEHS